MNKIGFMVSNFLIGMSAAYVIGLISMSATAIISQKLKK